MSWRVDETYVKVKGRWVYLYRAVDKHGDRSVVTLRMRNGTPSPPFALACHDSLLVPRPSRSPMLRHIFASSEPAALSAPEMTGRWQIAPIALTSGAYARRSCYRSATYRGLPAFVFTLHGRQRTIDFYLSRTRNAKAAKRFLGKALKGRKDWEMPYAINTDKAGCYPIAIAESEAGRQVSASDRTSAS